MEGSSRPPGFDVVVAGGGGSGLAAAASAAEAGLRVLVLEKRPALGGTTGIAVGSFTAARTRWQAARGIADRPEDHAEDAAKFAPPELEARGNRELRRYFLERAAETLDWLAGLGLAFRGPSPEPPNRVPRMHNVVPDAKAYIAALQAHLLRQGGAIRCGAAVEGLLREEGRVVGVTAAPGGEIRAERGVVLATGDYANSPELIARHKGERFASIEGINPHATGEGHRLLEEAGADLRNMDVTYGPEIRFVPPPGDPLAAWQHPENALFDDGAILLNREGRRFCDERAWPDREIALSSQPEKAGYILLDARLAERYSAWPHFVSTAPEIAYAYVADYLRLRPDLAVQGPSPEAAAEARGLPPLEVRASVEAFNRGAARPLQGDRWVLLGPAKACFTTTEGGAAIDEDFRVLDRSGRPIPGLYAVGQAGLGGQILWGHGLHIAWAITSGRLAGRALAGHPP